MYNFSILCTASNQTKTMKMKSINSFNISLEMYG